jgi:CBS domain-containing protein
MNNTDLFLDLYKQLEQTAIAVYGLPADGTAVSKLERFNEYKSIRSELKYCREVRALLSHNPKVDGEFAVYPSDSMIETLKKVISKIKEPPTCYERSVKGANILSARPEDIVFDKMKIMKSFGYSYVPIMKSGRVVGVFGKHTVFSLVLDGLDNILFDNTRFTDISQYTSLSKTDKNSFRFIPRDMYLFEAEELVVNAFKKKERINLLFVTQTGKPTESLLGILTPWDVMDN